LGLISFQIHGGIVAKIPATAGKLDIVIEQGATWEFPFTWTSGGNPVDITGYEFKAQIRKKVATSSNEPPVIIQLETPNEIVITDGPNGEYTITISDEITSTMPNGIYGWDMFVEFPSGKVRKLWVGAVEFIPNYTEPSSGA